jgi:hypothetical protein
MNTRCILAALLVLAGHATAGNWPQFRGPTGQGRARETTLVEAGPEFKVLDRNPLGENVQASPAISQGQLFIRTEKSLFCIGGS